MRSIDARRQSRIKWFRKRLCQVSAALSIPKSSVWSYGPRIVARIIQINKKTTYRWLRYLSCLCDKATQVHSPKETIHTHTIKYTLFSFRSLYRNLITTPTPVKQIEKNTPHCVCSSWLVCFGVTPFVRQPQSYNTWRGRDLPPTTCADLVRSGESHACFFRILHIMETSNWPVQLRNLRT